MTRYGVLELSGAQPPAALTSRVMTTAQMGAHNETLRKEERAQVGRPHIHMHERAQRRIALTQSPSRARTGARGFCIV